jgi:hypothetical protein
MPWIDNKYIFPRAAAANMQEIWPWPPPEELPPPTTPSINVKPLLPQPDQTYGGSYPGYKKTDTYPGGFTGLLENLKNPFSGVMESIKDAYNPYDNLLGLVGADARGVGRVAGVAGLLGGGPLAFGAEALAGLAEMSALNEALTGLGKSTGRAAPQISIWDAIGAGFNPFSDLQDVAQDYYADMYGPDSYGEFGDMGAYDIEAVLNPSAPGSPVTYSKYSPEPNYSYEDGYDGGYSAGSMSSGAAAAQEAAEAEMDQAEADMGSYDYGGWGFGF